MNEPTHDLLDYAAPQSQPRTDRLIHVVIVTLACFASTIIMFATANSYGSIRGAWVFLGGMIPISIIGIIAYIVGLAVRHSRRRFKAALAFACLVPFLLILLSYAVEEKRLRAEAPLQSFRELLENPIPASAKDLRFEPVENWGRAETILWFQIAPPDLDRILRVKGYVQVTPGHFLRPVPPFDDPNYLHIGSDDEFYQFTDPSGDLDTIRVNKEHTVAVLRSDDWRFLK